MGENLQTYYIKNGLEHLLKEWHPVKNGDLRPTDVTAGSGKKVYWILPYDDPITGKHFDFEWEATIYSRSEGNGCPFLSGKAVWLGFNDLTTTHPYIAKEWHSIRNEKLKPAEVTSGSKKEVWWINRRGKVWKAKICDRTKNVANN